ncbi:hypothetical protein [Calothrix sp. PCC 6303]|uniref:hypothetical protein n=1 Tax=Calothrix sp. PCC 6303 TaxID=1170562 RepID=UPI0002A0310D|nr:hypothetical protein [Calothrix sp. PCC 6303]AFZ02866.1 conserved repeat domain protein [Calothrix sp. PCC 6303]
MKSLFKNLSAIASVKKKNKYSSGVALFTAGALIAPQFLVMPAPVRAEQVGICATPGKDGTATISGIVNTYYPGTGTVNAGSTSVSIGAINPNGNTTPIAKGDLLLIIQMQDADINSTNTDAYGNGVGGDVNSNTNIVPSPLAASGYTSLNNAGRYEYAVANGPVSGGVIPLTKGTTYSYRTAAATSSEGVRSFQVVRVPQYTTATITGTLTTAAQWNGGSGGIVALDVREGLNFSAGSVVDVNGLGFRGGGSNPNGYSGSSTSTFRTTSQGSLAGIDGPKGEGIAGTPRFVARQPFGSFNVRSTTVTDDLGTPGYPNGDEGRGAPANAGGGGNEHNSGGGGGANGGAGGLGGRSYGDSQWGNTTQPTFDAAVGGFGGTPIAADPTRLIFGGGGGAGDTNDQAKPSGAGGGGGGMVLIRAGSVSGSGTINAKGADGIDSPAGALPDAGGGGGAGGTVLVTTATGNASGLTINATGGIGGDLNENNTTETDGPGAGGGGGVVYTTGGGATVNVSGGVAGLIVNGQVRNNTSNSATPGLTGINQTITASSLTTSISGSDPSCAFYDVSGTLYEDTDGGDDFDASEPKLPAAVKVILYKDNNNNNTVDTGEEVTNIPTNDQGQYTFTNVATGTYKVKVDTSDNDIPNGLTLGTSNDLTVNVSTAAVNNINFGFDRAQVSFEPDPPTPDAEPNPPAGICAAPGSDGTSTISGVVNTYYPGTQSASIGATQITIGAATGLNSAIKKGDKLLIIQMQDAEINSTNTDSYGNSNPGGAGSGSTVFNRSGYYQYVVADNSVAPTGGNLQIKESLAYTFTNADATSSRGQRRFQVIRLPQYRNTTISGTVTAAPWNGRSGGIVAVDVADTLTFSGAGKIDVSGQGFRGGGGRNTTGTGGTPQALPGNKDYVSLSTNPYHGSKGEGIAGTPKYIRNDVTTSVTINPDEGYPNGSFGRGAPGNAGGGSTDPNIEKNSANTGGGGGANRGFGGKGGDSWTDGYGRQPVGGFGGQAFLTTVNRIVLGGGGGAGTSNNSVTGNVPSGGGGGGIVMVRAGKISGTGTIEANGFQGVEPNGTDGGGGGGAGGTVIIQSVTPSTPNLAINARGGKGLDSGYFEHGPGGGGGGGYIAFQGITPTTDVSAGQPGNDKAGGTVNPNPDPYGATAGANGLFEQKTIPAAGVKPGAECLYPNVLLVKRITSVNNQTQNSGSDNLAAYKDQDTNPYDDNNITITNPNPPVEPADTENWLDPTTFLIGGINGGNVKPGDEIEYTIYYLSAGDTTASKVLICDRVPENVTFMPTAFNSFATKNSSGLPGSDRGIVWQYNGVTESLTNTKDGDTAEYLAPGIDPVSKYPAIKCDGSNTNGVVVVNLGNLPNATAPGTPINSYGFIRFRGKVK